MYSLGDFGAIWGLGVSCVYQGSRATGETWETGETGDSRKKPGKPGIRGKNRGNRGFDPKLAGDFGLSLNVKNLLPLAIF